MASLLKDATTTETSSLLNLDSGNRTIQAHGSTTSGVGAAEIVVEVSNNAEHWLAAGEITLQLSTTEVSDGFHIHANWRYIRARVESISGTGAKVSAYTG